MNTYKVIFVKNVAVSCELFNKEIMAQEYFYEHDKGRLIYALVNADTEFEAMRKCDKIVKEVTEKIFGHDFTD